MRRILVDLLSAVQKVHKMRGHKKGARVLALVLPLHLFFVPYMLFKRCALHTLANLKANL